MPPYPFEYQGTEAITFFSDTSVFGHFGLPRTLPRA